METIEIPKGFYVQINLRSSTWLKTPFRLSNIARKLL